MSRIKPGMVVNAHSPSYWKAKVGGSQFRASLSSLSRPHLKNEKGWQCSSVMEHLPSLLKTLSSIPSTVKKGKEKITLLVSSVACFRGVFTILLGLV